MRMVTYEDLELDSEREEADPFWWDMIVNSLEKKDLNYTIAGTVNLGIEEVVGTQASYQILDALTDEDEEAWGESYTMG